jgi:hypothetical protein
MTQSFTEIGTFSGTLPSADTLVIALRRTNDS